MEGDRCIHPGQKQGIVVVDIHLSQDGASIEVEGIRCPCDPAMEDLAGMLHKGEICGISNLDRRCVDLRYVDECSKHIILCDPEHKSIGCRNESAVVDVALCYHSVERCADHFKALQLSVMIEVRGICADAVTGSCDAGSGDTDRRNLVVS